VGSVFRKKLPRTIGTKKGQGYRKRTTLPKKVVHVLESSNIKVSHGNNFYILCEIVRGYFHKFAEPFITLKVKRNAEL